MTREQIVRPNWSRVAWILTVGLAAGLIGLSACGPRICKRTPITITTHPTKPRPAGRVTVGCDDQVVSDILADEVAP